tara:strand:+ start:570 stop:932 length:363 start_codon:yes stop_codon:yes gene_type:complete
MAEYSLTFINLNTSLQVGDMLYYTSINTSAGFNYNSSEIQELGSVTNISTSNNQTTVTYENDTLGENNQPTSSQFILFSKDNIVNTSSILGYYGEVKFVNESNKKAELYATACEISTSSK